MGDEEIIRRRLLIDGDGTGDARMIAKFTRSFIKWCFSEDGPQESQAQYERLLTSLASIEQSSIKWDNILNMNSLQLEHYEELKNVTTDAVVDAEEALNAAKQELAKAREVRNNGLQYHALAKLIQEHPSRSPTAERLTKLSASLSKLKSARDQLDEKLLLRKKQLHVLFTALHQLQATLDSDEDKSVAVTPVEDNRAAPLVDLTDEITIINNGNTVTEMDCT
ncbi:THO complex subunit 7 homolog [Hyalella azteca]|uniref:THO complex subunit 7 homolog n=1 Tax=Hyalella azteca TaxID=294128 RepID=A0A8B7PPH0_HYAAZ|nr:THO complex subunit 7 homolog [Hyalella azteca]